MKTLIVYYSRTGTTKKVGEKIAEELKADYEEIVDLTNRDGPIGWLKSGRDAMKQKSTSIKEMARDVKAYDIVIIGSPVWAGSVSPAVRTFLSKNKDNIKKAAFFCTMGGQNPSKIFLQMEELSLKPVSILALSTKEARNDLYNEKLSNFINEIKKDGSKK